MATKENLMGLGMPYSLSNRLGVTPVLTSVAGATAGAATAIGPTDYLVQVTSSNSGSGLRLPSLVSTNPALPGDMFVISNSLQAAIMVYASTGTNIIGINGVTASGLTGVSLGTNGMAIFMPLSASTWIGMKGASA